MPATDATFIIDDAESVFIVGNGIYRTGFFTGTGQVCNRTIGAGGSTHSAFLTLHGIDVGPLVRHGNGSEMAAVLTSFSKTKTAVVRYGIGRDGALFTSGINYLNDVTALSAGIGIFVTGKAYSSAQNFSLLIDTATKDGFGTGGEFPNQTFLTFFVYIILPGKPSKAFNDPVF